MAALGSEWDGPSVDIGGIVRKLIVAAGACAASLALAVPALASGSSESDDLDLAWGPGDDVAVEGITLDYVGFEILF